jgi:hypothetical protein
MRVNVLFKNTSVTIINYGQLNGTDKMTFAVNPNPLDWVSRFSRGHLRG